MARFRLRGKHYSMTVPPMEWEQREISQETGKQGIHRYKVPRLIDPDDPSDCWQGECVVSTKFDPRFPRDIVIEGGPTPEMDPLDDEAVEMMKGVDRADPFEGYDDRSYADRLIEGLHKMAAEQQSKPAPSMDVSALQRELAEMREAMAELKKSNRRI